MVPKSCIAIAVTVLFMAVSGCKQEPVPEWGYPKLRATLQEFEKTSEVRCVDSIPASCLGKLDRLKVLSDQAFQQVLEYKLLDDEYVKSRNQLAKAREWRAATSRQAAFRNDARDASFSRAVAAELAAYRTLLKELERIRVSPPPGDGWSPT